MLATIRAEITPGSVARSSSARWIGRTLPAMSDGSASGPWLLAGSGTDAPAGRGKFVHGKDDIGRLCVTGSSGLRAGVANMSDIGEASNQKSSQTGQKFPV